MNDLLCVYLLIAAWVVLYLVYHPTFKDTLMNWDGSRLNHLSPPTKVFVTYTAIAIAGLLWPYAVILGIKKAFVKQTSRN